MDKPSRLRWRVQGLPVGLDKKILADVLRAHHDLQCPAGAHGADNGITVLTLAPGIRVINQKLTATVRFRETPTKLRDLQLNNKLVLDIESQSAGPTRITIERHFIGLTVLTCPASGYPVNKQINVIAVPGLGGHPIGSFINKNDGHLWLVDSLAQDLPFARVMVYGYDSSLQNSNSFATVADLAGTLYMPFREILSMHQSSIPLIIIAHSLGGLLVKDVLNRIHNSSDDSELLNLISETISQSNLEVFCFYETETSPTANTDSDGKVAMTGLRRPLVDVGSATDCFLIESLRSSRQIAVAKSHSELVKFEIDDVDYHNSRSVLIKIHTKAQQSGPTNTRKAWVTDVQQKLLFESLVFAQMDDRRLTINDAHETTCNWLLQSPEYRQWLETDWTGDHPRLLWIRGNPGAGKSTIMKFAVDNCPRQYKMISFFFNARGHELEKSTTGMYRSLVYQLIEELSPSKIQSILEEAKIKAEFFKHLALPEWRLPALQRLLRGAVKGLSSPAVACFIDALDECPTDDIWEMLSFIETLIPTAVAAKMDLRICFASRHYPLIRIERAIPFILDSQPGHQQDITNYIHEKLKIGTGRVAAEARSRLHAKSSGIFMWVVLVVEILNKAYVRGRDVEMLRKLEEIPADLDKLFSDIVKHDQDQTSHEDFRLCIQWTLWAQRPMRPAELYHAILFGTASDTRYCRTAEVFTLPDNIDGFIIDTSKGLVQTSGFRVQLIHESVRDFFLGSRGFEEINLGTGSYSEAIIHKQLSMYCLQHIQGAIGALTSSSQAHSTQREWEFMYQSHPFLQYAVEHVLDHAEDASRAGADLDDFLVSLQHHLARFIVLRAFARKGSSRSTRILSKPMPDRLLTILAMRNSFYLIQETILGDTACFEEVPGRAPMLEALASNSHSAVRSMLQVQARGYPSSSPLKELHKAYRPGAPLEMGLYKRVSSHGRDLSVLVLLLEHHEVIIALHFPNLFEPEIVDTSNSEGRTLLSLVAEQGLHVGADLLLAHGASTHSVDEEGNTPLNWACMKGHIPVVKLLLDYGADIQWQNKVGLSSVSLAAAVGHASTVLLLIEKGANVESIDEFGHRPLSTAVEYGKLDIVRILLANGADVDIWTEKHRTPLMVAVTERRIDIVKALLEKGPNLNTQDITGRTALSWAAEAGGSEVVFLLLAHGARVDITDEDGRSPGWFAEIGETSKLLADAEHGIICLD